MWLFSYFSERKKKRKIDALKALSCVDERELVHQPAKLEALLELILLSEAKPEYHVKIQARYPLNSLTKIVTVINDHVDNVLTGKRKWVGITREVVVPQYKPDRSVVGVWADIWFDSNLNCERVTHLLSVIRNINMMLSKNDVNPNSVFVSMFNREFEKDIDKLLMGYMHITSELYMCFKDIYKDALK